MQIVVMAGFVVVMFLTGIPAVCDRSAPWWAVLPGVVGYVAFAYVFARWTTGHGLRRLMGARGGTFAAGWGPAALSIATQVYLVAGIGALISAGWAGLINRTLRLGGIPLVAEALAIAPFVAALVVYWWAVYPLDRAVRDRSRGRAALVGEPVLRVWTRGEFLRFNIRHNLLLVAVPVGLIVLTVDLLDLIEPLLGPGVVVAIGLIAAVAIFVSAPLIIVRLWRAKPLAGGALRNRFDEFCRQAGFACRDILLWDTGGVIVNAAVMGLIRPLRYVLLSDAMLEHFDDEAVSAVFAHEAGHVVHRHIPYMVLFTMGLVLLCTSMIELVARVARLSSTAVQIAVAVVVGALWMWLFGMLSRRFERQADVFAASTAPGRPNVDAPTPQPRTDGSENICPAEDACPAKNACPAELTAEGVRLFERSLRAVGRLNGIDPSRWNFRHGSIDHRVQVLNRLLAAGDGRAAVDRGIGRIKLAIWAMLALGAGATAAAAF